MEGVILGNMFSYGFLGMADVSPLLKGSYEPDTEAGQGTWLS